VPIKDRVVDLPARVIIVQEGISQPLYAIDFGSLSENDQQESVTLRQSLSTPPERTSMAEPLSEGKRRLRSRRTECRAYLNSAAHRRAGCSVRVSIQRSRALALLGTLMSLRLATAAATAGDLLISGGPIYTGADHEPKVEAVVVRGERIAFVGALAPARRVAREPTYIDLNGASAYPGFVDAHSHLTAIGLRELTLNLEGLPSIEAVLDALRTWAAAHPGTEPIRGRGWIETHWPEKRFLTRADLDRAVKDRPVYLERSDGHAAVGNSAALALAHIDRNTPEPPGGKILRDVTGEPTGLLVDNALNLVSSKLPQTSKALRREALVRAVALYASRGWTGTHNMSVAADDVAILQALAAAGQLPIRVDNYMVPEDAGPVLTNGPWQDASGLVRVRGVKLYMDGALGSRGAALLEPYSDAEGSGLVVTAAEVLAPVLKRALKARAQVATHAIGDRGNRLTLDAYDAAFKADFAAARDVRWRIEHAQVLSPVDIPRFAQLGIIASMQPSHAISDLFFAPARLGPQRLKGAYAWRSLVDSGAIVAAGTDAPVERGDPLIEFYAATYRHDLKGYAGADWHLEEAVSRDQALRMLTSAPAYAVFRERELGTLEVGKRADITAFSANLMTAPFAAITRARAVLTVVDGRVVYRDLARSLASPPQATVRICERRRCRGRRSVRCVYQAHRVDSRSHQRQGAR
jgi:predicted amidohydrolase YtcJ